MTTLYRVDAVLSFAEPVDVAEVERLRADLDLPAPRLATGQEDPSGSDLRVDGDGEGADLVLLVEAEDDGAAQRVVEAAVTHALGRSPWAADAARLDLVRATPAYEL